MTDETLPPPATQPVSAPRRYPSAPLVGVAAVVFDVRGQVLLVQRGREPSRGAWGLPGGLIDIGEALVDAVRREVLEETGLDVEVRDLLAAFEPIIRDSEGRVEYHYVVLDYWALARSGEAAPSDDAAAVAWVDARDAAALASYRLAPETARVVQLGLERHAEWQQSRD
jgi:ADP-ribose pyrophosphatase YjhB (NUDIX family)